MLNNLFDVIFITTTPKVFFKINYYWCPHTDSKREPTDYKSESLNISSQIDLDSTTPLRPTSSGINPRTTPGRQIKDNKFSF